MKHFSSITNNNLSGDDFSTFNYQNTFQSKFYENVYFVQSVNNTNSIDISWSMPSDIQVNGCVVLHHISLIFFAFSINCIDIQNQTGLVYC